MSDDDRHFERVLADLPAESDILGPYSIDSHRNHPVWKAVGIAVLAACAMGVAGTVVFVLLAFGFA